ncbi:MAG: hypothetical protein ACOYL6_07300 [Bacteriovoracaceae bacterium]
MLQDLHVSNIPAHLSQNINVPLSSNTFTLKTCQRTLVVADQFHGPMENAESYSGLEAYLYLLETICGLKSRLVGENEIVNQFKDAYQNFMMQNEKSSTLIQILEKLFQDAKDIRTKHLIGIGQKSYATISRRHLVSEKKANTVLIMGSGILAEDMINQLKKKCQVMICGRNKDKVEALALKHGLEIIDWKNKEAFKIFPHIVNTIGTTEILFSERFFYDWYSSTSESRLFIDLGSPSALSTSFTREQGVIRLEDIFEEGAIRDEEKLAKIREAKKYLDIVAMKRSDAFRQKRLQAQSLPSAQA